MPSSDLAKIDAVLEDIAAGASLRQALAAHNLHHRQFYAILDADTQARQQTTANSSPTPHMPYPPVPGTHPPPSTCIHSLPPAPGPADPDSGSGHGSSIPSGPSSPGSGPGSLLSGSGPSLAARYARARELQAECHADEIIALSDTAVEAAQSASGPGANAVVQAIRLQVESRKWVASKLRPQVYGDKVSTEITGPGGGALQQRIELVFVDPAAKLIEQRRQTALEAEAEALEEAE